MRRHISFFDRGCNLTSQFFRFSQRLQDWRSWIASFENPFYSFGFHSRKLHSTFGERYCHISAWFNFFSSILLCFVGDFDLVYAMQETRCTTFVWYRLENAPEHSYLYWSNFKETKILPVSPVVLICCTPGEWCCAMSVLESVVPYRVVARW